MDAALDFFDRKQVGLGHGISSLETASASSIFYRIYLLLQIRRSSSCLRLFVVKIDLSAGERGQKTGDG
jgi:hypothetical protein